MEYLYSPLGNVRYITKESLTEFAVCKEDKYIIASVDAEDFGSQKFLLEHDFKWHDTVMAADIFLKSFPENKRQDNLFSIRIGKDIDTEVKKFAHGVFLMDRRFHFGTIPDQANANQVMDAFFDYCREEDMWIVKCLHEDKLYGFIILRDNGDETASSMLGGVERSCQGQIAVRSLYVSAALFLKESGFKRMRGTISSSNISSINLHIALGAKFTGTTNKYIWRATYEGKSKEHFRNELSGN